MWVAVIGVGAKAEMVAEGRGMVHTGGVGDVSWGRQRQRWTG